MPDVAWPAAQRGPLGVAVKFFSKAQGACARHLANATVMPDLPGCRGPQVLLLLLKSQGNIERSLVKPARLHFARTACALAGRYSEAKGPEAFCPNFQPRALVLL